MSDYDLLVIGAGSGGLAAAKRAASYGARVAIVEGSRVGGTCVIKGCVPKKVMVYASQYGRHRLLAGDYGWPVGEGDFDWAHLVEKRNSLVDRLEKIHEGHLERAGVTLLRGWASLKDGNTVEIGGKKLTADRILLAMGGSPVYPGNLKPEDGLISDDLFQLEEMPRSAILVGGGYIGVEFAGILQGLGCQVTLVTRTGLLKGFDETISEALVEAMKIQGIKVYQQATVEALTHEDHYHLHIVHEGHPKEIEADTALLFAIGRKPRTRGMGLEEAGVKLGTYGEVLVDEDHATSVPGVFAVGDVLNKANLTPVAIKAGRAFADTYYGDKPTRMDYSCIATAVFSQPPIGTVGMTEAQAVKVYGPERVKVYNANYVPLAYTATPVERKYRTVLKMVVHSHSDRVLGIHMLGDDAPEILQGFAVALKAGATKADFDNTIAIHPTQAEELVLMR
jgi:glutathione reductase (NADPH)